MWPGVERLDAALIFYLFDETKIVIRNKYIDSVDKIDEM